MQTEVWKKMREIIKSGMWSFVKQKSGYPYKNGRWSFEKKWVRPEYSYQLKKGDYILFYLSQEIKGGRSIIAKARLGSPYLEEAKYTERNCNPIMLKNGVFIFKPEVNFFKKIEPRKYGIGRGGRGIFIIPIEKREYDSICPPRPEAKLHPQHSVGIIKNDSGQK